MNSLLNLAPLASNYAIALIDFKLAVPIVAISAPFLFVVAIVGMILFRDYRTKKLQQETIHAFIEKGMPVPPEILIQQERKKPANDRRSGLILIAVGIALYFFFNDGIISPTGDDLSWIGLIPGLIGVAMLTNWYLEKLDARKKKPSDDER